MENKHIIVNDAIANMVEMYMVDMIVYGSKAITLECQFFSQLHKGQSARPYVALREWDIVEPNQLDRSLSRCTLSIEPYQPTTFRLGNKSPGFVNDCRGVTFVLEDNIEQVAETFQEVLEEPVKQCSGYYQTSLYESASDEKIRAIIKAQEGRDRNDRCREALSDYNGADTRLDLQTAIDRMENIVTSPETNVLWESTLEYEEKQELWKQQIIASGLDNKIDLGYLRKYKINTWFQFLYDTANPDTSTIRCRICASHYDQLPLDNRHKPRLALELGWEPTDRKQTTEKMKKHYDSKSHTAVIKGLKEVGLEALPDDFINIQSLSDKEVQGIYKATADMLRVVITEIQSNTAFDNHLKVVKLVRLIKGENYWNWHYSPHSAAEMARHISNEMHKLLLSKLKADNKPFSIIVDGSTDASSYHYLAVYFQMLDHGHPIVVLYRLIKLGDDETAQGLLDAFKEQVDADGLRDYFKKNLVGFSSDGKSANSLF
jgi:hypothetical protein